MTTILTTQLLAKLRDAAVDATTDDFCSLRHEGQARFDRLMTPEIQSALECDGTPYGTIAIIDARALHLCL
jgi:hypothetical protein